MPWYQTLQIAVLAIIAIVTFPSVVQKAYSRRLQHEEKVKRLVDLADKLPVDAIGREQIESELSSATLDLAFDIQYPKSIRDRAPAILTIAILLAVPLSLFVLFVFDNMAITWLIIALSWVGNYLLWVARINITENDKLIRQVFEALHAPKGLARQKPSLFVPLLRIGYGDILEYAATVRAQSSESMTMVEAVNAAIPLARKDLKFLKSHIRKSKRKFLTLYYINTKLRIKRWILRTRVRLLLVFVVPMQRFQIRRIAKKDPEYGKNLSVEFEKIVDGIKNTSTEDGGLVSPPDEPASTAAPTEPD
ncbi:hypothetical protein [Nocardia salmonicida]|uniref:hypothetical protein n=1 Tax=Nocardia salmonicida TaxID=53431 RepID=UPI003CE9F6CB